MSNRTNRNQPVERWPESVEILRLLISRNEPLSVVTIARDLNEPEISTRNRLLRLEVAGAVHSFRRATTIPPVGPERRSAHYVIDQYGRDCVVDAHVPGGSAPLPCVNSVFALAAAMGLENSSPGN